jgi:hypothetical protein
MSTQKELHMNNPFHLDPTELARAVAAALGRTFRPVALQLGRVWATHKRLLANNPAYATALASGVAAIVRQISGERIAIAVLSTLIAVYLATRQDQRPRGWGYDDGLDVDLYPY